MGAKRRHSEGYKAELFWGVLVRWCGVSVMICTLGVNGDTASSIGMCMDMEWA